MPRGTGRVPVRGRAWMTRLDRAGGQQSQGQREVLCWAAGPDRADGWDRGGADGGRVAADRVALDVRLDRRLEGGDGTAGGTGDPGDARGRSGRGEAGRWVRDLLDRCERSRGCKSNLSDQAGHIDQLVVGHEDRHALLNDVAGRIEARGDVGQAVAPVYCALEALSVFCVDGEVFQDAGGELVVSCARLGWSGIGVGAQEESAVADFADRDVVLRSFDRPGQKGGADAQATDELLGVAVTVQDQVLAHVLLMHGPDSLKLSGRQVVHAGDTRDRPLVVCRLQVRSDGRLADRSDGAECRDQ